MVNPLPTDAADLTPEFLSGALGTEVTAVELLEHAFATNQRARITLTYATEGAGPASLFVKLAPLDPAHREMIGATGMGEREAQFYVDVAPSANVLVPACAFAASQGDAFVLLLEDLAAFHARFEDSAERNRVMPWSTAARPGTSEATSGLMRRVLDENAGALTHSYRTIGELYVMHHAWFDHIWHTGPDTYIHGDTHIGNVLLDGDRVGFLDWSLSRTSTHLRDVSYFLTMSVDIEERRRDGRELLQGYLDVLRAHGGIDISFDDAWATYRLYAASDGVGLGDALLTRSHAARYRRCRCAPLQVRRGYRRSRVRRRSTRSRRSRTLHSSTSPDGRRRHEHRRHRPRPLPR